MVKKLVVVNYVSKKYKKLEVKVNTYYYTQIGSVILLIRYDREYRFRSAGEEDIKSDALAQLMNGNANVVYNTSTRDMTVMLYFIYTSAIDILLVISNGIAVGACSIDGYQDQVTKITA